MKRTPMRSISAKRRAALHQPAVEREPHPLSRATRRGTYAGNTSGTPVDKDPHSVNVHLRNLARGEACTGHRYGGYCHCDPATTVLAHTNSLADCKGMGYKAHDHLGAFLGMDCHAWLDQGNGSADERAAFMAAAQERTRERWRAIASDPAAKPWRRNAAQWALDQLKARTA